MQCTDHNDWNELTTDGEQVWFEAEKCGFNFAIIAGLLASATGCWRERWRGKLFV